uniref:Uncharacterized protein n=1 Tax=Trichuris muris TaxID=70415 RepID=A0A5S6QVH9_TRIMR
MKLTLLCVAITWIIQLAIYGQQLDVRTLLDIIETKSYTKIYTASSLSEVLSTVRDPYKGGQIIPDFDLLGKRNDGLPKVQCITPRCLGCAKIFIEKVIQTVTNEKILKEAEFLWHELGLDDPKPDWECNSSLRRRSRGATCTTKVPNKNTLLKFVRIMDKPKFKVCQKRETPGASSRPQVTPVVIEQGKFVQMFCRKKGDQILEDPDYTVVCPFCEGMLFLGENKYPPIIREVRCQQNNSLCLSGHCQCLQGMTTLTVFNVTGHRDKKEFPPTLIHIATSCTPYLHASSALRNLIYF